MQGRHGDWFSDGWWRDHPRASHARWHYHGGHHHGYWWRWATAPLLTGWFVGSWGSPAYYDYGSGGDVYYEGDTVYVGEDQSYTGEEYAQQAAEIADSAPDVAEDQVEWMPLGTFALTHDEKGEADMLLQLTVSKEGIIAGTYFNTLTDSSLPVEGMVDQETQRAAWTIGNKKTTVLETGIYNLTQDEAAVLVHFGQDRTQQWLMVRLDPPEGEEQQQ